MRALGALGLWLGAVAAAAADDTFVTRVGRRVLARTTWGGQVVVERVHTFRAVSVARVRPQETWFGDLPGRGSQLVLAGTPRYFSAPGKTMVLFLRPLGGGQWRALARLTLESPAARRRARLLQAVVRVETSGLPPPQRARRVKGLFLDALGDAAVRLVALAELEGLARRWPDLWDGTDRARLLALRRIPLAPPVRRALGRLLAQLGAGRAPGPAAWGRRLAEAPDTAHRLALLTRAVAALGSRALPLLAGALAHPDPAVRERAAYELGRLGDPVAAAVLTARLDREAAPLVRGAIAEALGRLRAAHTVPLLAALAREAGVAPAAVRALGRLRTPAARAALRRLAEELAMAKTAAAAQLLAEIRFVLSPAFLEQERRLQEVERRKR